MFRLSIVLACWAAAAEAFAPGMPLASAGRSARAVSSASSGLRMQSQASTPISPGVLTKELFTKLDVDGSGALDASEIRQALGGGAEVDAFMARADLNGDGTIDYAEYERLMNMAKNDDAQGGNLFVRNALKLGLLKKGSVLEDCVLVGNKGFDPLGLAKDQAKLMEYREAELKHGRLAMLAAAGWPVSELLQPYLAKLAGAPVLLADGLKAPSVLNGGLDAINPAFFMGIIIFTATVESIALNTPRTLDQKPGDLNFDPLRLYYGKTEDVKRDLELKELNNGRLAMLAITAFAAQEFITKAPVA